MGIIHIREEHLSIGMANTKRRCVDSTLGYTQNQCLACGLLHCSSVMRYFEPRNDVIIIVKLFIGDKCALKLNLADTYSTKQPDLYYFETIKMTSQA